MLYDRDGRKNPETKKNPRSVALPSASYVIEADYFLVSENPEKQAGPTLSERGAHLMEKKEKKTVSGAVCVGRMNLF